LSGEGIRILEAEPDHVEAILALLPRLADYDIPPSRNARDLWRHDAELLRQWQTGEADCIVHVAVGADDAVVGLSLVRLRPELLSEAPSAHLEALAVDRRAEGKGIARALLQVAEEAALAHGAESMTLHVFAVNRRARRLYERAGYDGELMRYIKHLDG
jgi:ribosomal protein S18 acetylase RimI-like enzyme